MNRKLLSVLLLLAALLLVNYLASRIYLRHDATAEKLYTLSPGTKALLAKIEDPIQLDLYFSKGLKDLPLPLKNFADRVEQTLRHYSRNASGKITVNVLDTQPDSPEEEKATAAGLDRQMLQTGSGETFFFGLVATQADQQKTIAGFSPNRETFLEYDLSQLIHSVQLVKKKRLGLLSGIPLRGQPQGPMMRRPASRDQLAFTEWSRSFEIVTIEPTATELPANLDALAVVHPQNLSDKLQYTIDQFILSGQPTLLAVDPASQPTKQQSSQMGMFGGAQPDASSDLPKLFPAYGITYNSAQVVGDLQNGVQLQSSQGSIFRHPAWIGLSAQHINRDNLATAQLDSLMLIEPGSFTLKPTDGVTITTLAETSSDSGETAAALLQTPDYSNIEKNFIPSGKKTVVALLSGKLKSAFPDGAPKDPAPTPDSEKKSESPASNPSPSPTIPHLTESKSTSTLFIIADTDWLLDDYSVRRTNVFGSELAEPLNDNLALATNTLDYLTGSRDLLSLRGKGNAQRPFTVVRAMEQAAQQKFEDQRKLAQSKLEEVQKKMTELQGQKTDKKLLVATPEVTKAIEDYRRQESVLRRELREIRRDLRRDIDLLGHILLGLNILVPALAVLTFGLLYRRQRKAA